MKTGKMIKKVKEKIFKFIEIIYTKIFGEKISDIAKNFLKDLSIVTIGMLFSSALLFFVNVFGARIIGPEEYGKFQIIYTITQFLLILMLFGLNTATAKYLSENINESKKEIIKNTAIFSFIFIILFFTSVFLIFDNFLKNSFGVEKYLFDLAVYLGFIASFYFFSRSVFQGLKKMKVLAIGEILYSLTTIIIFFIFIFCGQINYKSIFYGFLGGYLAFFLVFLINNKGFFSRKIFDFNIAKKLLNYGAYAILGSVSGILLNSIDKIVLNKFFSLEIVGVYSVYTLASTIIFSQLVAIFIMVFFPYSSGFVNKNLIAKKINKVSKLLFISSFFLSCIIMYIILKIIGNEYSVNINYILLFSLNTGLLSVFQVKMWLLNSSGLNGVKKTVYATIIIGILNTILNFILIPSFEIYGAISATLISSFLLCVYFTNQINIFTKYE